LHWGTRDLVNVLVQAALELRTRFPDSKMPVGNLSARTGGEIPFSVSHQSGRDADIGFILHDTLGRQVLPLPLVRIEDNGKLRGSGGAGNRSLFFDLPRNWVIIRTLVTNPRVQLVYIAEFLKRDLLKWAESQREPSHIIAKARDILRQPLSSSPHDDHLHVRIYCNDSSLLVGCVQDLTNQSGTAISTPNSDMFFKTLVRMFDAADDYEIRRAVLYRLGTSGRSDLVEPILSSWPFSDNKLEEDILQYLSWVELTPFRQQIVATALKDISTWGHSPLVPFIREMGSDCVLGFIYRAVNLRTLSPSTLDSLVKLSDRLSGPLPLLQVLRLMRSHIAVKPGTFLEAAGLVLNRRFQDVRQLEQFLLENYERDVTELLLESLPSVCSSARLKMSRLLQTILKGGPPRFAAVRILKRLFDRSFDNSLSNKRMFRTWKAVVKQHPEIRHQNPCNFAASDHAAGATKPTRSSSNRDL